ncbi:MAG: NUDIX domain-containing protein, partial [Planctomycetota bacterium]|jgi:8-oxo-dGTP pyrophosphatase MutT (NUDIX family)
VREAREEMGVVVAPGEEFHVCPTADGSHELHFLTAEWTGGTAKPSRREVRDWGWYTLAEAEALDPIFPADLVALRGLGHR